MMKLRIAALAFIVVAAMPACKKDKNNPDNGDPTQPTPTTGSRLELSLDSLYLYAKETYLWYESIPDYATFNPRKYASSDEMNSLRTALFNITRLAVNPATDKSYEYYLKSPNNAKFSFIEKGNAAQGIKGAVDLEGAGDDLGLSFAFTSTSVYVRLVEKGGPAQAEDARVTRGCQVIRINDAPALPNSSALTAALSGNSIKLELRSPGALTTFIVNIKKAAYTADPVNAWTVIDQGANITGYLSLARFSRLSDPTKASLNVAFAEFARRNVNNLVIDFRYNGGGYVATAEYLANLIGPSTKTQGKVMYIEKFNKLLQEGKAPILKSIPLLDADGKQRESGGKKLTYDDVNFTVAGNTNKFAKVGSLGDLKNVVFIASELTASASELVINSLKPFVNVKLVGPHEKTYGKPVGFFGIGIDKYTVYMSQFSSVNSLLEGDYFDGMPITIRSIDDVTKNFGDPTENSLETALKYINGQITGRAAEVTVNGRAMNVTDAPTTVVAPEVFPGLIEDRRKLK